MTEQDVPLVCFEADILRILGMSRSSLYRALRARTFPIPELPRLDTHRRWSRDAVLAFLSGAGSRPVVVRRRA